MHDEVLNLMDDCLTKLMVLRAELAAARRVRLGERRVAVLRAIDAAAGFAEAAALAIGEPVPPAVIPVSPAVRPLSATVVPIVPVSASYR
ncbi:hypothetical protein ACWT_6260 [Actinoplanes sp. SE50]|uniref:hypothetical protein n=1 Tax=unclassified Actinoplanes TaxID=2626549 RepID=UPI00023ED130|nr:MULTISPECIES: hypothetical protein [unclassified Actinoplanes]AEV87275.1 hypothetical protein ACPL_6393 [Actinoplanes sp. SE50/110]ATO85675.1 hypothetical protein ACWT_6260 [Actinoplanes sp. SE50]SLM03088.1 hypothetical protein ACSP50_6377 [Actinoplanes sp. SE50/110]